MLSVITKMRRGRIEIDLTGFAKLTDPNSLRSVPYSGTLEGLPLDSGENEN